jgi:UDP-N-acetylmuramoyl-tripeptide--D-alanyl-D-alanine ligase
MRIVAITGSYGKTTTKEAIAAVLAERFAVCKALGTENNELGIPRTVARCAPEDEVLVLEMGAQWRGEIAGYCRKVRPHVGVVTAVGPVHLELFGSIDLVQQAKSELVHALPGRGAAILNRDDARVWQMRHRTRAKVSSYGLEDKADVSAQNVRLLPDGWTKFDVMAGGIEAEVKTRILGQAGVYAALAATAVGRVFGLSLHEIAAGLGKIQPAPGRLNVRAGRNGSTLLDDAYNANRISAVVALELLTELGGTGQRIAVLGDMLEMGEYAAEEHRRLGEAAGGLVDRLVTIGTDSAHIATGARRAGLNPVRITEIPADRGNRKSLDAALDAAESLLAKEVRPHDVVLVKGSHGMGLYMLAARWAAPECDDE